MQRNAERRGTHRAAALVALSLFSLGCLTGGETAGEYARGTVSVRQIIGAPDQFGRIHDYLVLRDHDVVTLIDGLPLGPADQPQDHFVVASLSTGLTIATAGRFGQGSGELTTPTSISRDPSLTALAWVWDQSNSRLTAFSGPDWGRVPAAELRVTAPGVFEFGWLGSTRLIGSIFSATHLLRFFDVDPERRAVTPGTGFGGTVEAAPEAVRLHLNRASFAVHTGTHLSASAFLYSDDLHVYDVDGNVVVRVKGPVEVEAILRDVGTRTGSSGVHVAETRFGYLSVDATTRHIYALFSGRRWGDYKSLTPLGNGQEVHVFAWDGRLVGIVDLEEEVARVKVDERTGRLFGIRGEPYAAIIEFEAPTFLPPHNP